MTEQFIQTTNIEQEHRIGSEEFEMRFAQFISDPVTYLELVRVNYLDEHEGDISELVTDVVDEIVVYLEHADEVMPQIEVHSIFRPFLKAHDQGDMKASSLHLFTLLQKSGYQKNEIIRWIESPVASVDREDELKAKGDRIILNEIYASN